MRKSNGEQRFVLNLKKLNKFITATHFKMEDIRTAIRLLTRGCYMGSLDLQSTYSLIFIDEDSRKCLHFKWRKSLFEFVCLPFSFNIAPWLFTKITKPLVRYLRNVGLSSVVYLDD